MLRSLLKILGAYSLYEQWLLHQVRRRPVPQHIAVILDGNRRWAREKLLDPWVGHYYGAKKAEELLRWCLELGVKTLTLYAFSTENFKRPREEVEAIFKILEEELLKLVDDPRIHEYEVRVKLLGRKELLPEKLRGLFEEAERKTEQFSERFLNIAVAYGGRAEIVDAVKRIAEGVERGEIDPGEIDEGLIERYLYTAHLPNPYPDLIIRTSGEERLSGFLLWQSAYSELCFLDVYWPEFRRIDLLRAIRVYQSRQRRFGG
ncbi:MAG: polyprenyl diphosphate synthase [Candidatus Nezhaarchaeota archaeon]|nr:polyprenyl diphosphate synthase [Candidatus Nezhaarchaeota archaeon]